VGCRAASIVCGAWLVSMRFVSHRAARCFYGREGQAVLISKTQTKFSKFHKKKESKNVAFRTSMKNFVVVN
jgi:hypothetical protein